MIYRPAEPLRERIAWLHEVLDFEVVDVDSGVDPRAVVMDAWTATPEQHLDACAVCGGFMYHVPRSTVDA